MTIQHAIAENLRDIGGLLRCTVCGYEQPLGDTAEKFRYGWPSHCGYTMRWVTARQLAEGDVR